MAKEQHALLQKKIEELKSQLKDFFALPAESPFHQLLSESINGRFAFLKKLLSAEIQSQPKKRHHLHHIAQKLEELESAFKDGDSASTLSSIDSCPNEDEIVLEDCGSGSPHLDSASTCSCTDSYLDDDEGLLEDGVGGGSPDLPGISFEGMIKEQQAVATVKDEGCGERLEERRVWLCGNKVCAVMSGVLILSVAVVGVVMASFCGSCCYGSEMEGLLTPT